MNYTDVELKRWWDGLAEAARQELLQKMVENAKDEIFCEFAMSLRSQWDLRKSLSPRQLAAIKKWER